MTGHLTQAPVAGPQRALLSASLRLLTPFWRSRSSLRAWLLVVAIGGGIYFAARLAYWSSATSGRMTNAVVAKDIGTLVPILRIYFIIMVIIALIGLVQNYFQRWIEIDWRRHLVGQLLAGWLRHDNFYRLERDRLIGNSDQRIADDSYLFIHHSIELVMAGVAVPTMISVYATLLWTLGGPVDLSPVGLAVTLQGGLFWLTALALCLVVAFMLIIGYPLISLNVERQRREADFRFTLANLRINAEQIALYGGAPSERERLERGFGGVVSNWYRVMLATIGVVAVSTLYAHTNGAIGLVVGYGPYARGSIDFGHVTQIGAAVGGLALSIYSLVDYFKSGKLYVWVASVRRLDDLIAQLAHITPAGIAMLPMPDEDKALLATVGLRLERPDGGPLAEIGEHRFAAGERWLVQGPSGVGKSTLLRALAGLWPYGGGEVRRSAKARMLFLPQKSYIPAGTLVDALCYPSPSASFAVEACQLVLRQVKLSNLVERLHESEVWQDRLSLGEQQRFAFARALLQRPDVLLLDEATSALDIDTESHIHELLDTLLGGAALISVGHRATLERFHPLRLSLSCADGAAALPSKDIKP